MFNKFCQYPEDLWLEAFKTVHKSLTHIALVKCHHFNQGLHFLHCIFLNLLKLISGLRLFLFHLRRRIKANLSCQIEGHTGFCKLGTKEADQQNSDAFHDLAKTFLGNTGSLLIFVNIEWREILKEFNEKLQTILCQELWKPVFSPIIVLWIFEIGSQWRLFDFAVEIIYIHIMVNSITLIWWSNFSCWWFWSHWNVMILRIVPTANSLVHERALIS